MLNLIKRVFGPMQDIGFHRNSIIVKRIGRDIRLDALVEQYEVCLYHDADQAILSHAWRKVFLYMGRQYTEGLLSHDQLVEVISAMIHLEGK